MLHTNVVVDGKRALGQHRHPVDIIDNALDTAPVNAVDVEAYTPGQ